MAPKRRISGKRRVQEGLPAPPELEREALLAKKMAYLVTLPHPQQDRSADGHRLVAPRTKSKQQVLECLLDACARPVHANPAGVAAEHTPVTCKLLGKAAADHGPDLSESL